MENTGGGRTCVDAVHRRIQQVQKGRGDRDSKSISCGATMEKRGRGSPVSDRGQGSQTTLISAVSGDSGSSISDGRNNNNIKLKKSTSLPEPLPHNRV